MEKLKNIKLLITNQPDEVIGYYGSGSNSMLFISVPLTFLAGLVCNILSYGGIPFVIWALLAWYKVFFPGIYFVINNRGIAFQSAFGFFKKFYNWSEIEAFHFTVKIVHVRRAVDKIENKIVFIKKDGRNVVVYLFGMEGRFNEIHKIVETLAAKQNINNEGIMQL